MNKVKKGCILPFVQMEITPTGDVLPCCSAYNHNYSFGNIYKDSIDEIWHGSRAKTFRENIRNNDYSLCDLSLCMTRKDGILPSKETDLPLPKYVKLSHDSECNIACNMCRHSIRMHDRERLDSLNRLIEPVFLPALQNASVVYTSGAGDPFASRHMRKLIKMASSKYHNLKFDLQSNGQMCNKTMLSNLGIEERINSIQISVHAFTEQTYNIIIPPTHTTGKYCGGFNKLKKNLLYISELHQKKLIREFNTIFVIQECNIYEIYDFAAWMIGIGAKPMFWTVRNHANTPINAEWDKNHILNPEHKKYAALLNELEKTLKSFGDGVIIQPQLLEIMAKPEAASSIDAGKSFLKRLLSGLPGFN